MRKAVDLSGETFNMVTVLRFSRMSGISKIWLCLCECGNEKEFYHSALKAGKVTSCGCIKHKMTGSKIYATWRGMKRRCYSEGSENYANYGGRGIKVCDRWTQRKFGFSNFYEDMGDCPEGYTLDRINVDGDYTPENCRWADKSTQAYNQRRATNNTSGKTGVWEVVLKGGSKWASAINENGNRHYLGCFETFEEALNVRVNAELTYFGVNKD